MLRRAPARMPRYLRFALMVLFLPGAVPVLAQEQPAKSNSAATPSAERQVTNDKILLPKGTKIRLVLLNTISSKTANEGDAVTLQVLDPVKVDNLVVVANKAPAKATVTAVKPAGRAERGGSLALRLEHVTLIDQRTLALQSQNATKGRSENAALDTVGVVLNPETAMLAPIALPVIWLSHGDQAVFGKGTVILAETTEEVVLDRSAVEASQPPVVEKKNKEASVTIYWQGERWPESATVWCGQTRVGKVRYGRKLTFQLSPGRYPFRIAESVYDTGSPTVVQVEAGDDLYIGVGRRLSFQQHDVGEVESEGLASAEAKDVGDLTKVAIAKESFLEAEIMKIDVGTGAQGIAFAPGAIWVACENGVARINEYTYLVEARIPTGRSPSGVAADQDGVWIANRDDNTVTRIDPDTNRLLATIQVGKKPLAVEISNGSVWVTNTGDGTVSRIAPQSNTVIATIHVGKQTNGVSANRGAVWVAGLDSHFAGGAFLRRIDPSDNAVAQSVKGPWLNVVLAQGDDLWVSGLYGTIFRIDARSGSTVAKIVVAPNQFEGLSGLAVSKGFLWAADMAHSTLWKIDIRTNAVVGKVEVGNGPVIFGRGVDDDGAIWVTNIHDGTVMRVQP